MGKQVAPSALTGAVEMKLDGDRWLRLPG